MMMDSEMLMTVSAPSGGARVTHTRGALYIIHCIFIIVNAVKDSTVKGERERVLFC